LNFFFSTNHIVFFLLIIFLSIKIGKILIIK